LAGTAPVAIGPDVLLHAARAFVELVGAMLVPAGLAVYPVFSFGRTLIGGAAGVLLVALLGRPRDLARPGRPPFAAAWVVLTSVSSMSRAANAQPRVSAMRRRSVSTRLIPSFRQSTMSTSGG